jgi:hypothetical protein
MKVKLKERIGKCEIEDCNITDLNLLHAHHILERTELNSNNNDWNIAIICSNHHNMIHAGKLKIIGIFPSTKPPVGRSLVYIMENKQNLTGDIKPYYSPKAKSIKI